MLSYFARTLGLAGVVLAAAVQADDESALLNPALSEVTVSAERLGLLGGASAASEGAVADEELQLSPVYRPGQLLETVPGLIVTLHSGEGKANQFLLRGYNLDHGTDLATFVDGMLVNEPTHAHGQGYTDLNFVIPELASGLVYTKGPYYADVGDFGAVGSVRLGYRNSMPAELSGSAGSFDYQRYLGAASTALGAGTLLAAAEAQHYDGPFSNPDDARKQNLVLRYSRGDQRDGWTLTGMYYHQLWTNTTDIPLRALAAGLVADRFGTLDPSDGGRAQRASASAQFFRPLGAGALSGAGYFIYNQLHMYSDFTHFLIDPVHGDQEQQFENRHTLGASIDYTVPLPCAGLGCELSVGGVTRYDQLSVGRLPTQARVALASDDDPPSFSDLDRVNLSAAAAYLQASIRWSPQFRTLLGVREDYQHGSDIDELQALHRSAGYSNAGRASQGLLQPKASLIYTVTPRLEFYLNAGHGFHSADIRGVNQDRSVGLGLPNTPLLARQEGQELGLRAQTRPDLAVTLALYNLWQQSETIIDPDIGKDVAGPPSRRYGAELNVTLQLRPGLALNGSFSANHTRFTRDFDDGTGHLGRYITDAPVASGSLALYFQDAGPWSGGLDFRYLGHYALSSSPCVNAAAIHDFPGVAGCADAPTLPGQVDGRGFGELNLDAHYAWRSGWVASLGLYNLLDTHAPAAQFWYVDRLRSEIDQYPAGRADVHQHPLEPLMARLTISRRFGS